MENKSFPQDVRNFVGYRYKHIRSENIDAFIDYMGESENLIVSEPAECLFVS